MSDAWTVPQGYKESKAPELFKFDAIGQMVEGVLLAARAEVISGDRVLELYISNGRGDIKKVRCGYDLKQKIKKEMVGQVVLIRYMSDDAARGKEGNAMKVFYVGHKPVSSSDPDDPGITDEDIPF